MVGHAHWLAERAMSEYFKALSPETKKRYLDKLDCVGLGINDDPYLSQTDSADMSIWPSIKYGHIISYYIGRPGTFTQEELLSWKQMDAYNYFMSGHVWTIYSHVFGIGGKKIVILKALVNSSQRTLIKQVKHESSLNLMVQYFVDTAHAWLGKYLLSCQRLVSSLITFRLGESCSHVAAILFKIESAVRLGYTSVTSVPSKWNDAFDTKVC